MKCMRFTVSFSGTRRLSGGELQKRWEGQKRGEGTFSEIQSNPPSSHAEVFDEFHECATDISEIPLIFTKSLVLSVER